MLYEHANFNGDGYGWAQKFGPGKHTGDFPRDIVSSYEIDRGCCATFYEEYEFKGKNFNKCGPVNDGMPPNDWNDRISSMKVECHGSYFGQGTDKELSKEEQKRLTDLELDDDSKIIAETDRINEVISKFADPAMAEAEIWEIVPGYIVMVILWCFVYYPPIQDILLMAYYFFYGMG